MPEAIVSTRGAIDNLLAALRRRLEAALENGQAVRCHAREGMKRGSFVEADGSFDFTMRIDPKP